MKKNGTNMTLIDTLNETNGENDLKDKLPIKEKTYDSVLGMKVHHSKSDVDRIELELQKLSIPIDVFYSCARYQVLLNGKTVCCGTSKETFLFLDGIRRGYAINH
jgi:hypothetical protein